MDKRKVLLTGGMGGDRQIILTDIPKQDIETWLYRYNEFIENGESLEPFDTLKDTYYIETLYDSELSNEDVEEIGYNEVYDLFDYYVEDTIKEEFTI